MQQVLSDERLCHVTDAKPGLLPMTSVAHPKRSTLDKRVLRFSFLSCDGTGSARSYVIYLAIHGCVAPGWIDSISLIVYYVTRIYLRLLDQNEDRIESTDAVRFMRLLQPDTSKCAAFPAPPCAFTASKVRYIHPITNKNAMNHQLALLRLLPSIL